MCAVEDAEPWTVHREVTRTARKAWKCCECKRGIAPGERYRYLTGLSDGHWSEFRWCLHCEAAGRWMWDVCGGYLIGDLLEELAEHWHEGYVNIEFGRLIVGVKRGWHDGADPIPEGVANLAERMLRAQVAA